jgi:hypothetical protein
MRMGKTTFINHCVINFNEEEKPQQIIQINFKSEFLEGKKIHYFPFAEGMAELLPYNKFNDAADEARKSGNIIGNLIGSISSAAKILVDENETKATDLEKISDIIIKKIYAKKTLIIFDNIDLAMDENKELFILLLNKILIEQGKIDNSKFSNNTLSLVFLSLEGFHVKKEFENLIDALMELNTKQELIWKANHNNDSDHISNHLPYFNLYPNHDFLDKYLTKSQVSLFDKKELSEKFRKTDKDRIPGVIADSIKKLKETKQLRDDEKTGVFEYISKFAEESLPETPQQLGYFVKVISGLSDEQRELLRVCAYSALNEGEFEVEAVCVLSGLNRLVVLNMFSKLEKLNIIYDEKKRNDWYRFNDLRFLIVLKDFEGDKLDDVSILAKEFYKKWSKFYYHQFSEVEKKVWLNKDLLMKLAERLFIVALDNPNFAKEAKEINEKVGLIFLKPENAFFDQSEKLFNAAIKIVERYPEKFEEKDIFYLQIKGLLMTYRCKNELTTDKATKIFNQKSKIIEQCNELKFDLQLSEILLFILNINPYRDDFQEELKAMNKQVDALILDATISLSKNVRLKFYKLLLVLKGGKPINEINELADKYKSLLIDIDALPSLKNECIEEGVYLEILNSYGQLIVDNVLGHNDQSFALSTKEAIFEDAIKILSIRLNYEVIKTNQEANESDDLTKNILEKLKILQLPENKHKFDRTGLCFTLNFITRAFYNINYSNKKLQIRDNHKEVIINCSTFALRLNKELDTNIGVIIAASLNGEIFEYYNDHSSSLESYEIAFAYSFPNNYNQFRRALDNMKRLKDNKDIDKKRILHYQEMSLKRHLLCHFDDNSKLNVCEKQELLERDIIKNELDKDGKKDFGMKDLEKLFKTPGSKFRNEVFSNPNKVIDFSKKLLRKHENEIVEDLFSKYLSIDLNIEVGIDNLIPLSFITDDNKNNVLKEKRNNYYCNVIKGIAPPKTSFITIILEKGNELEIKTIFPGKFAPPFPVESQTKEQFQTATKFWEENVFIG